MPSLREDRRWQDRIGQLLREKGRSNVAMILSWLMVLRLLTKYSCAFGFDGGDSEV